MPEFSTIAAGRAVRNSSLPRSWKQVLRALVDYADGAGVCWPSRDRLASDIGVCPRTIQRAMQELKRAGLVAVIGWRCRGEFIDRDQPAAMPAAGRGWVPVYRVCLHQLAAAEAALVTGDQPAAMPAADVHQPPGPAVAVPAASDVPTSVPVEPDPEPVVQPQEPEVLPFIPAGDEWDKLAEETERTLAEAEPELRRWFESALDAPELQQPPASGAGGHAGGRVPPVQQLLPGLQPQEPDPVTMPAEVVEVPAGAKRRPVPQGRAGGRKRPGSSSSTVKTTVAAFVPPTVAEATMAAADMVTAEERERGLRPGVLHPRVIALKFVEFLAKQSREPVGGWRVRLERWVAEDAARVPPMPAASDVPTSVPVEPTAEELRRVEVLWKQLRAVIKTASTHTQLRGVLNRADHGGVDGPLAVAFDGMDWKEWQRPEQRAAVERRVRVRLLAEVRLGAAVPPVPTSVPGLQSRPTVPTSSVTITGGH